MLESLKNKSLIRFFIFALLISCLFLPSITFAKGLGRVRTCDPNTGTPDGLEFNPTTGGKDAEFVMSNPVCISVMLFAYANTKIALNYMNNVCGNSGGYRVAPSPLLDSIDLAKAGAKILTGNTQCGAAVLKAGSSFSLTMAVLGGIYNASKFVYDNSQICGANWVGPSTTRYTNSSAIYKAEVEALVESYIKNKETDKLSLASNKIYREWYYGGVEVESDTCLDVASEKINGEYPKQKYYLRGLETGNFNCERYNLLPGQKDPINNESIIDIERTKEFRSAYKCCKDMARDHICIEYLGNKKFCRKDSRCGIGIGKQNLNGFGIDKDLNPGKDTEINFGDFGEVFFQTRSLDQGRLICAETYSLCPYNFYLGGGTEVCDYYQDGNKVEGIYKIITPEDVAKGNCANKSEIRNPDCTYNSKAGKCRNYCQYMRHCTRTDISDYQYISSITSPYFSNACLNFVGDSKNMLSYGTGFVAGSARHFSTPIVQCVKETLENVFYNRAGHTKCYLSSDPPIGDACEHGAAYKTGDKVANESFFSRLQKALQDVIRIAITLSIIFYGTKFLFVGKDGLKKSDLVKKIIMFGIIFYFALGNAWQTVFFDGVYNTSATIANIIFKIQVPKEDNKRDGCQFGVVTLEDGSKLATPATYPKGKEYLAMWDTLDCKIARYLGYGPEVSVANIAKLILAGFLTGSPGIYFSISLLIFGITLILAAVRAIHIFILSSAGIILLVYISPLIITLSLFPKTEKIFKSWVTQLISFCLQPMILFAYLGIFITVMDKTLLGSASFYGEPPYKTISCTSFCKGTNELVTPSPECNKTGEKMVKPRADSFACMISYNYFGDWPGLELFGISIPFILELFMSDTREKILTIVKSALIMYFLFSFIDEIPSITTQLLGGALLESQSKTSAIKVIMGASKALHEISKRARRGAKKGAQNIGSKISKAPKETANEIGNKGKSQNTSPSNSSSGGNIP